jgi:hypothetical protein
VARKEVCESIPICFLANSSPKWREKVSEMRLQNEGITEGEIEGIKPIATV